MLIIDDKIILKYYKYFDSEGGGCDKIIPIKNADSINALDLKVKLQLLVSRIRK